MRQADVRQRYSRRLHFGETPFAVLKAALDLRRFLLRSHLGVQQEWRGGSSAYHLKKRIRRWVGLRTRFCLFDKLRGVYTSRMCSG